MSELLAACPMPRAIPCEVELSDGLNRAASIEYLAELDFLLPEEVLQEDPASTYVGISSLVAMTLRRRGDGRHVVVKLA